MYQLKLFSCKAVKAVAGQTSGIVTFE